jgi:ubiquinone/menaquinone biosynthesis C-methylase UbiE
LYVGIDGSAAMLERARATISDERAAFVEAELGRVSLGCDGRFDLALVCLVLEHLADVGPVLAAAARALAPGGRLLVLELAPSLHARGVGANFRDGDGSERRLPSFRHDADELLAAARAAGFIDAAARTHAPTAAALARSAKLARYLGEAVLLELAARR